MARTFPSPGKGGLGVDPAKTALLCIEFQNEFTSEGGKLYPEVKDVMLKARPAVPKQTLEARCWPIVCCC